MPNVQKLNIILVQRIIKYPKHKIARVKITNNFITRQQQIYWYLYYKKGKHTRTHTHTTEKIIKSKNSAKN